MACVHRLLFASILLLRSLPAWGDQDIVLTVEPEVGRIDQTFLFTVTNRGSSDYQYDACCAPPVIRMFQPGDYLKIPLCPPCDPCPQSPPASLRPGESFRYEWAPADTGCAPGMSPQPGMYKVWWSALNVGTGRFENADARFEILPRPDRELRIRVEPEEPVFGETARITIENISPDPLAYDRCRARPRILLPTAVRDSFCPTLPPCIQPMELAPGEIMSFDWTPGAEVCSGYREMPGPFRIIWGGFWKGGIDSGEEYFGEIKVMVLPPADQRIEISVSPAEVRAGDLLKITATNTLQVPVSFGVNDCCFGYVNLNLLDQLGRDWPCWACDCVGTASPVEVPPGGSFSADILFDPDKCRQSPGHWSVSWEGLVGHLPGPTTQVSGAAPFTVLSGVEHDFIRGNCDGMGKVDLTDAIFLLQYLFLGGAVPGCLDACDDDDSGALDLTDAIAILSFLFLGSMPPPAPFPDPGPDPTPDAFGCGA